MKKIGFTIVFLLALLMGVVATKAQSNTLSDYEVMFSEGGRNYRIDKTSVITTEQGSVVFWSVAPFYKNLVFMKIEVDCANLRVRSLEMMATDGVVVRRRFYVSDWYPREDAVSTAILQYSCKAIDNFD